MRDSLRLYLRFLGLSWRAQLEYRASFLMHSLGNFLITGIEFLAIWALFARFEELKGWTLAEVALLYGLTNVSFACAQALAGGFHFFAGIVRSGDFDRLLVRPRSTILQVMGQRLSAKNIGRLLQGLAVTSWALSALPVKWSLPKASLLVAIVLGGGCLFYGLFVLQATVCFWTTESLELMNILTFGGAELGGYPLHSFPSWLRLFFTFLVPLGCVSYYPLLTVLEREDALDTLSWLPWCLPGVGLLFLGGSLLVWRVGVRHYTSTGS